MKPELKQLKFVILTAWALLLTACQSIEENYYDLGANTYGAASSGENLLNYHKCPAVKILEELSMLRQFTPSNQQTANNTVASITLKETNSVCEYDNLSAVIDMNLEFNGKLGPKGRYTKNDSTLHSYPFFVAIADRNGKIMAKEIFVASIHYPAQNDTGVYRENIRQIIPVKSKLSAKDYSVIVGFQLSNEELAYNREFLKKAREQQRQQQRQQQQNKPVNTSAESP